MRARIVVMGAGAALVTAATGAPVPTQCAYQPTGGCSAPQWTPDYSMRGSTYTYCFGGCPLGWLANNTQLGQWKGVVGVDHYWTQQGMPCIDGIPQEFPMQAAWARQTKATFPGSRVLSYRITSAVPYDNVVHQKIVEDPTAFVQWSNGSVCQMPYVEHKTGRPGDNCSWPIIASAYNWARVDVQQWFIDNVIKPVMVDADGAWIDGDGPDNGAWMCSGSYDWGNLPAPYPALNASGVDAFCAGEQAVVIAAQKWLIANGGFDYNCFSFVEDSAHLPNATDTANVCIAKVQGLAKLSAPGVVLWGDRTGDARFTEETTAQAAAVFMLVRGDHWWMVMPAKNTLNATATAYLLTDYGMPLTNMTLTGTVFTREYEQATVTFDCSSFTAEFLPREYME